MEGYITHWICGRVTQDLLHVVIRLCKRTISIVTYIQLLTVSIVLVVHLRMLPGKMGNLFLWNGICAARAYQNVGSMSLYL